MVSDGDGKDSKKSAKRHHRRVSSEQLRTPRPRHRENKSDLREEHPDKPNWVEKGTLIVLGFTLLAACFAGYEAGRLADLTHDMERDAQAAADLTHADNVNSLDAVQTATNETREASNQAIAAGTAEAANALQVAQVSAADQHTAYVSAQRAFVFVNTIDYQSVRIDGRGNGGFNVETQWRNSGTTPTRHFQSYLKMVTFPGDIPKSFKFPDTDPDVPVSATVIGPGQLMDTGLQFVPASALGQIATHQQHFYFYGYGTYRDIFGGHHETRYCIELRTITIAMDSVGHPAATPGFANCTRNNCADDECKK
jgi:hypothetical protein